MSWLSSLFEGGGESSSASSGGASIWPSIIAAGASLAGTYFQLNQNKQINASQIELAQRELDAKIAAEAAAAAKGSGGGGGGSGAALQIAKMGNLSQLYQNWGQLAAKAAESESQSAQATGRLATDPIIARLGVLR